MKPRGLSLDNWSVSFFARHSSMVADLNVRRLHEVVELATLEADTFSLTYISAEVSSFFSFLRCLERFSICRCMRLNIRVAGGNPG